MDNDWGKTEEIVAIAVCDTITTIHEFDEVEKTSRWSEIFHPPR
jgi:hypothetical protein